MVATAGPDHRQAKFLTSLVVAEARKRQGLIGRERATQFFRLVTFLERHFSCVTGPSRFDATMSAETSGRDYGGPYGTGLVYSGPQTVVWYSDGEFGVEREAAALEMWLAFKCEGLTISLKFSAKKNRSDVALHRNLYPTFLSCTNHLVSVDFDRLADGDYLRFRYSNELLECKKMHKMLDAAAERR